MDVVILAPCKKEIDKFPLEVREDLLDVVSALINGVSLAMPLSRKMEGMGPGVYELRFKDRAGIYRVIYFVKKGEAIYLIHAFKKTTNKTSKKDLMVARRRMKELK